jgi:aminopeptidase N
MKALFSSIAAIFFVVFASYWLVGCAESGQKTDASMYKNTDDKLQHDVHSFSNLDRVLVKHLHLNLTVNMEQKRLEGSALLHLIYLQATDKVVLDAMGLHILKVLDPTTQEQYRFVVSDSDSILGEAISIFIGDKKPSQLEIQYKTSSTAAALQWIPPALTTGKKQPLLFSQSQAILARSWIPLQDSPKVRFTYSAEIHVPIGLMALMSASNPQNMSADGIYFFEMKQPIPSYLMALAVGSFRFQPISKRTGIYAEHEQLEAAFYEFVDLEKMVVEAEKLFGPYVWDRYDLLVLPSSFPFGGMENPRLTFLTPSVIVGDRSLTSLVAHELAHSWSGNLVTNASWNDFWLNEGFTVYFERRIMEALYGKDYADMLRVIGYGDLVEDMEQIGPEHPDTHLKLDLSGRNPDDGLTDIAYEKGYFFLSHLEQKVGRPVLDTFLRDYFRTFAFQSIQTEQFLPFLLSTLCKKDESLYRSLEVESWIYSPGLPSNFRPPISTLLNIAEAAAEDLIQDKDIYTLVKGFNPFQHMQFLRRLDGKITLNQLQKLDSSLRYSDSPNPEVRTVWLTLALPLRHKPALYSAESFLKSTGRRKFLVPVYKALIRTDEGKIVAKHTYQSARSGYHYIAVETLDRLLEL